MTIEAAIAELMRTGSKNGRPGKRGKTASPGHQYYERGRALDYKRCECSYDSPNDGYDFIAIASNGKPWYVGINGRDGTISCGPKGFHYYSNTPPCFSTPTLTEAFSKRSMTTRR